MVKVLVPFSRWLEPLNRLKFDTKLHCDKAKRFWRSGKGGYDYCAFVGGNFLPDWIETIPIAILMRDYVVQEPDAIESDKIIIEGDSANTWENIEKLVTILKKQGIQNFELICLSQWQHIARIWLICRALNVKARYCTLWYFPGLYTFFYEWVGLATTVVDVILYKLFKQPFFARLNSKMREQRKAQR